MNSEHRSTSLLPEGWRDRQQGMEALAQANPQELEDLLIQVIRDHAQDLNRLSAALNLIQQYRPSLTPSLTHLLGASDPQVRLHAALALGLLQDQDAVPALIAALQDGDINTRFNAIEALGRMKAPKAVQPLMALLNQENYFDSYAVIQALGEIGDPQPAARLRPLLDDPMLGEPAVLALGKIGSQEDAGPITCWISSYSSVPLAAVSALISLEKRAGSQVVKDFLTNLNDTGRSRLLDSVPRIGEAAPDDALALAALAAVLSWMLDANPADDPVAWGLAALLDVQPACRLAAQAIGRDKPDWVTGYLSDESSLDLDTRQALLEGVRASSLPEALQVLLSALDLPETELSSTAAAGLADRADPRSFDAILGHLSHPSIRVRRSLLRAVRSIPTASKFDRLVELLDSNLPQMRESAVAALSDEFPQQAAANLLSMLADPSPAVRRGVLEALPRLDDPQTPFILAEAVRDSDASIRAAAVRALSGLSAEIALPQLKQALSDPDMWVRMFACRSLEHFSHPESTSWLCDLVDDPATPVRLAVISALRAAASAQAVDCIRILARHSDPETRAAAEDALRQPGDLAA